MKTKILFCVAAMAFSSLIFAGCSKEYQADKVNDEDLNSIVGSSAYFSSLGYLSEITTKAGEADLDALNEIIQPLLISSKDYLLQNGYNYLEDFEENDSRIILTAYALLEMDLANSEQMTKITITDVVSCVFLGDAVGNVVNAGASLLAKRVAKKVIARSIPGVGIAIGVVSAGKCIYDNWDGGNTTTPIRDDVTIAYM